MVSPETTKPSFWVMLGVDTVTLVVVAVSYGQQIERNNSQDLRIEKMEQAIQLLSAQSVDGRSNAVARLSSVESRIESVDNRLDRIEDKLDRALPVRK